MRDMYFPFLAVCAVVTDFRALLYRKISAKICAIEFAKVDISNTYRTS